MTTIQNLKDRILNRYLIYKHINPFTKKNINRVAGYDNTICLFTQPRGGSTWLAEILLNIPGSCLIDEPLWRGLYKSIDALPNYRDRKVPRLSDLNFYFYQPIPPDSDWPEAKEIFEEILGGRVPSLGLYRENNFSNLKNSNIYIIKFNFGHLLMQWMCKNFNFKALAMIRHPCAVIASQVKSNGFKNLSVPEIWSWPDFRYNELYLKNDHFFKMARNREEILAVQWAIQTQEVISAARQFKFHTLFYENLVNEYESEVTRIFDYLDIQADIHGLTNQRYKPSKSTFTGREKSILKKDQLSDWKVDLSVKTQQQILGLIKEMGIDLYDENIMPLKDIK